MEFFKRFLHSHPYILKEGHDKDDISLINHPCCRVCRKQVNSDPFYWCDRCDGVYFHKSCTERPISIQHPLHPDHPLLLTPPTDDYEYNCDACKTADGNYFYHCDICYFDLDLECALITERTIDHPSHKHPLTLLQRASITLCDACGTKHEGFFYACPTCDQFWIHRDCASLPTTFENNAYHAHPLTLEHIIPDLYDSFDQICQICEKNVNDFNWVCHCERCRFIVHLDCIKPKSEHFLSVLLPNKQFYSSRRTRDDPRDFDPQVVQMPLQDEFASLVNHFHEGIILVLGEDCELFWSYNEETVLVNDVQGKDNTLDILHDHVKYQKMLCNVCKMPTASNPHYKCVDQNKDFILHKCCDELPLTIQHPFHPEHLLTIGRFVREHHVVICSGCKSYCGDVMYACSDCNYFLDVICATLPSRIKHDAHMDHPMSLKLKISRHCSACRDDAPDKLVSFAYHCDTCDFELHARCAILPLTVRHRYDEDHPYRLTYRPVEDHYSNFLCDICETQINPVRWFYHCVDCDRSMHTLCHPIADSRSRIKFGGITDIGYHAHPLHMVPVIEEGVQCNGYVLVATQGSLCSKCGRDVSGILNRYGGFCPVVFKCRVRGDKSLSSFNFIFSVNSPVVFHKSSPVSPNTTLPTCPHLIKLHRQG